MTRDCPSWSEKYAFHHDTESYYMSYFRQEWILRSEKSTVFNIADVSLSAKEAQRRRATLSQSPAMQSSLPATVSFVQPDLFFPVAPFQNVSVTRKSEHLQPRCCCSLACARKL